MRFKITSWFLLTAGGLMMLIGTSLLLMPQPVLANPIFAQPIVAQCGSQASSCKNCHEVKGEDPVNSDGTGWHESHAFGDFCILCHAGNEQATVKEAAHTGMVPPLEDIKTSCQSCHADDVTERADVYAQVLNIEIGGGTTDQALPTATIAAILAETQANTQPEVSTPISNQTADIIPSSNELVINDPNVVDYVQTYNQIVLGERPVNWGNIILVGLIGLVVIGGGGFILFNEMRLRLSGAETRQIEGEYPAEVVDLLPAIAGLKSQSRQSLKHILNHPKTDAVLGLVENLVSDEKSEE